MRVSNVTELARLEILANQANLINSMHPEDRQQWFYMTLRHNGYNPGGEICHKAVLIVDEHAPRIRLRISYIDDQTRWQPTRVLGSFYLHAVMADGKWSLTGDY